MSLLKYRWREKHYQPSLQISEKPWWQQILCQGPRLSLTLYTSLAPAAKSIWSHAFSLLCIHALKMFFHIYSCLNLSTWVMCQHCMALDQQLPSLITLLMFAFDCISTKDRIMFCLFWHLTEHFQIGVDCLKSSTRHTAISSNYPVL